MKKVSLESQSVLEQRSFLLCSSCQRLLSFLPQCGADAPTLTHCQFWSSSALMTTWFCTANLCRRKSWELLETLFNGRWTSHLKVLHDTENHPFSILFSFLSFKAIFMQRLQHAFVKVFPVKVQFNKLLSCRFWLLTVNIHNIKSQITERP